MNVYAFDILLCGGTSVILFLFVINVYAFDIFFIGYYVSFNFILMYDFFSIKLL